MTPNICLLKSQQHVGQRYVDYRITLHSRHNPPTYTHTHIQTIAGKLPRGGKERRRQRLIDARRLQGMLNREIKKKKNFVMRWQGSLLTLSLEWPTTSSSSSMNNSSRSGHANPQDDKNIRVINEGECKSTGIACKNCTAGQGCRWAGKGRPGHL